MVVISIREKRAGKKTRKWLPSCRLFFPFAHDCHHVNFFYLFFWCKKYFPWRPSWETDCGLFFPFWNFFGEHRLPSWGWFFLLFCFWRTDCRQEDCFPPGFFRGEKKLRISWLFWQWWRDETMLTRRDYRVAKIHRVPWVVGHFSRKSLKIWGSFAENDDETRLCWRDETWNVL